MSKPFPIWPQQLLLTGTSKQEQTYKQIIYLHLSDIIHAPYVISVYCLNTRNTLNNKIDTYMFIHFLSENGMSRLWKKIPTKQDLFNGEKIIFSADIGILSSIGARSSMKVSKVRVWNECGSLFFFFNFFWIIKRSMMTPFASSTYIVLFCKKQYDPLPFW